MTRSRPGDPPRCLNNLAPGLAFDVYGPLPSGVTLLEASAGTGKTFTIAALVARYVAEGTELDAAAWWSHSPDGHR